MRPKEKRARALKIVFVEGSGFEGVCRNQAAPAGLGAGPVLGIGPTQFSSRVESGGNALVGVGEDNEWLFLEIEFLGPGPSFHPPWFCPLSEGPLEERSLQPHRECAFSSEPSIQQGTTTELGDGRAATGFRVSNSGPFAVKPT